MSPVELKKAVLSTLAYADIFDYPLKKEEIWRFLLSDIRYQILDVSKGLKELPEVSQKNNFYFLKEREHLVLLRKKRERWSRKKLKIAKQVARCLKLIPTIKMVAVTGALAMENSNENDDIDLLIITSKSRLWLTRFLTVILLELVANRRHPADKEVKDKICLNMFLDEGHLEVPKKEQDLFSSHEVCQLKVLWDKNGIYQKFLKANLWSKKFLPNWKP
ncbi:hypothetical protein CO054_01470 [Candidatus Shapirobacteria bacterium CG_4_9_14_0_2_um_filter_39_11]|uniref:Polymerase nucleotidyl transferase domain-containing protein n=1 Tax=Candidatus Shapirobacteria bacterium CG_4_9_14_0_2_um_filter_39_11 TaxID=1974478 RepID=A0A2M8ESU8_9BACT|nr:MAG: hypothetical protein CO054_01470 [Candidatus Shapirobacteria bacterium CG_4_9_14_0_2_um_filter_39_11]